MRNFIATSNQVSEIYYSLHFPCNGFHLQLNLIRSFIQQAAVPVVGSTITRQVCSPGHFFSDTFFVKKIIDLPGEQIYDPFFGNDMILFRSFQQLSRLGHRPLKGLLS